VQQVTEARVLAAVDARKPCILQHAATVTPNLLLAWLREDLGVPDAEALRPHRRAAKQRARQLLEMQVGGRGPSPCDATLNSAWIMTQRGCPPHLQGQLPGGAPGHAGAGDLPLDVLPAVLRRLDHDSLFCALQACKAWHAAGCGLEAGALWEEQYIQRGWLQWPQPQQLQQGATSADSQQQAGAPPPQSQHAQQGTGTAASDWRRRYREQYMRCCYECFQPTERHTLLAGSLRVRLCQPCSAGHASHRPHHRLMSATSAKQRCCLRDAGASSVSRRAVWACGDMLRCQAGCQQRWSAPQR
jgi:hypothetical protein